MYKPGDIVQFDDLVRMGGKFYSSDGDSYCDTPLNTWKLDLAVGFVCIE